jgi:hypothetical protein
VRLEFQSLQGNWKGAMDGMQVPPGASKERRRTYGPTYTPLIASLIVLVMCCTLAGECPAYELRAKAPREGLVHALG